MDPELKGQIINSGVRVILACLLSWRGWRVRVGMGEGAHRPPPPLPVCVEHAAIRGEFGHGGRR